MLRVFRLEIVSNMCETVPLLQRRQLDIAVISVPGLAADGDLHITPLARRQGYLVVRPGHPLLKHKGPLGLSDVLHYPLVSTSRFPAGFLREFVSETMAGESPSRLGPRTVPSIACESVTMMRNIAQESDAVAMLPLSVLLPDLKTGAMAVLPVVSPVLSTEFGIVRLAKRSLSPLGETFVRTMLALATEVAAMEENAAKKLFPPRRRVSAKMRQTTA